MALAWALIEKNISLIVWIGTGGMMAAFADASIEGKSVTVDSPDDWDPWRRAAAAV